MSFKSALLLFVGLVLAAGFGVAGFFWYQSRTVENLSVTLSVPDEVLVGAPFDLMVAIKNDSRSVLKTMSLMLEIPQGMVFVGGKGDRGLTSKELGDVGVGGFYQESFNVMVTEGEQTVKHLRALVSYQPGSLGSRFEKEATFDLSVGGQALRLELVAPQKTFSGEEIEFKVSYQNVSGVTFSGLELQLDTPPSFSITYSSLKPDFNNTIWTIGDLTTSAKNEIVVRGIITGPEGSFYGFRAGLAANFAGRLYTIAEKSQSITISTSPLSLEMVANDNPTYIAQPGDSVTYRLTYRNNTTVGLRDVIIKAKLIGVFFDIPSVSSRGFLRSPENTVMWTAAQVPELDVIPPAASGFVDFSVGLKPEYPIKRLSDKNFVLKVEAEIESPTVPPFVGARKTIAQAKIETKVRGFFRVDARGFFRDAASGILNRGPLPPVVGTPTQFTIHWLLWNYGTDISNVELRSFLGGNVRFTGVLKSNTGILPTYNDRTQEIVWNMGRVIATKGISDDRPLEAIFQVELTPGINQVGGTPKLVEKLVARATDDFTNLNLTAEDLEVETNLPDDPTIPDGRVIAN